MANLRGGLREAGLDTVMELPNLAMRFLVEFLLTTTSEFPRGSSFAVTAEATKPECQRIYLSRVSYRRYQEWSKSRDLEGNADGGM